MRILIDANNILDTETHKLISNDSVFDKDCSGVPVVYNLHTVNNVILCSVCWKGKIIHEKDFNIIQSKVSPYNGVVINDTVDSGELNEAPVNEMQDDTSVSMSASAVFIRNILKGKVETKAAPIITPDKINRRDLYTEDLSKEEREQIKKQNIQTKASNYCAHRFIDTDELPNEMKGTALRCAGILDRAKQIVRDKAPFYSLILGNLNQRFTNRIPTLAVSPGFILYNPDFMITLRAEELAFVLCHEAMHIRFMHHTRLRNRNSDVWNLAGDTLINYILCQEFKITPKESSKYFEFCHGGIYYPIDTQKENTDTIYDKIMRENRDKMKPKQNSGTNNNKNNNQDNSNNSDNNGNGGGGEEETNQGNGSGSSNSVNDNNLQLPDKITIDGHEIDISGHDYTDLREDSKSATQSDDSLKRTMADTASETDAKAKRQGIGISGDVERLFNQVTQPDPPSWVSALMPFLSHSQKEYPLYSKSYKNRLTVATGFKAFYPGYEPVKEKLENLILAVDTSGSVDDETLEKFYNQAHGLFKMNRKVTGTVCAWDTKVKESSKFSTWEEFKKFKPKGCGGTEPECIFPWAKEHKGKYLVIYTDGYFTNEKLPPSLAKDFKVVIWVLFTKEQCLDFKPPFGIKCI